MNCILFVDIPHFSAVCLTDKYSIRLTSFRVSNAYNSTEYIIGAIANNVNLDLTPKTDRSIGVYLQISFSFLVLSGEQCPDGRFLLVGNSQALLIIAVAMAARSFGTLF